MSKTIQQRGQSNIQFEEQARRLSKERDVENKEKRLRKARQYKPEKLSKDKAKALQDEKIARFNGVDKSVESGIIRVDNIGELSKFGLTHSAEIRKNLAQAPDNVKRVWNDCVDDFRYGGINGNDCAYSPNQGCVYMDLDRQLKLGSDFQTPYEVVFHEFGHNADHILNKKYGDGNKEKPFSVTFENGALGKKVKEEAWNAVKAFADENGMEMMSFEEKLESDFQILTLIGEVHPSDKEKGMKLIRDRLILEIPDDVARKFCQKMKAKK